MQKLVWQNAKGDILDLTSGNYGITEWEGFSNTSLNIQTQTVPFQDGSVFLDALIEQRELTVTLAMQDNNNLALRYEQRRELISALNPKLGEGYLIYTNDYISKRIKCVPQIPVFENHNSDTAGTPKASLSWTACSPYWEDIEETVVELPLGEEVTIENTGDVPAMPKIELNGTLTNPVIVNQDTDKAIKLEMTTDKNVIISTETGKKGIYTLKSDYSIIEGVSYNDSIQVGSNTILVGGDICIINEFGVAEHYNSPISQELLCIKYANGVYLIGTKGQGVLRSTNAVKWEVVKDPYISASGSVDTLSFVNNVWFACGMTSSIPALIMKSTDNGLSWEEMGLYEFYQQASFVIFYNNTYYIKNGSYFRCTTDFTNWNSIQPENIPNDIIEIETNHWIGVTGSGQIVESTNPATWTVIDTPTQNSLNKIVKINNKYFGLGYLTVVKSDYGTYAWSDITPQTTSTDFYFMCVTFILNQYAFYTNKGSIFSTTNLSAWNEKTGIVGAYKDIIYAFNNYYLLYNNTTYGQQSYKVYKSADLKTFEELDLGFTNELIGLFMAGNQLVIYSYSKVMVTTDGENFTEKNTGLRSISKIQFANNKYFVNTYTTQYTTFVGEDLESLVDMEVKIDNIVFYNGIYYRNTNASSNGYTIYSSADLENWNTLQTSATGLCAEMAIFKGNLIIIKNYDIGATISTTFYCFDNLEDFTQYKSYSILKGGIKKLVIKGGILWVCGNWGLIGQSTNGFVWSIQYTCGNHYNSLCIEDKKVFVGTIGSSLVLIVNLISAGVVDNDNNLISKMSTNSNLNWELTQGENVIHFTSDSGEGEAIITFRQKYIGV